MDVLLMGAIGPEAAEVTVAIETDRFNPWRLGVQSSFLILPETGVKAQAFVGSDYTDPIYWQINLGGVVFNEPVPDGGTNANYAIGARLGYKMNDEWSVFAAYDHYSNGHILSGRPPETNPGFNTWLLGTAYHF